MRIKPLVRVIRNVCPSGEGVPVCPCTGTQHTLFRGVIDIFSRFDFSEEEANQSFVGMRIDRCVSYQFQRMFRTPCKMQGAYLVPGYLISHHPSVH